MSDILKLEVEQEETNQEYEGFQITDDHLAEWAIQKIKEAKSDTDKWQAHFAAQLDRIRNANQSTINFMTSKLGAYFVTVPHKETKTQIKYELPSATLIRKSQQPAYTCNDVELLTYLDESGRAAFVKTIRTPDWGEYKKLTTLQNGALVDTETGEIVRGVIAMERPDIFDVKIKEV